MRVANGDFVDVQTTIKKESNDLLLEYIRLKKELGQKVSKREFTGEILNDAICERLTKEIQELNIKISEIEKIKG